MTRDELKDITFRFTAAFNRDDLDGVMAWFADDAVYDEFNGVRHEGKEAIRAAFEPMFAGKFGKIRFEEEDLFLDPEDGKAMMSWSCVTTTPERRSSWRGLDLLHVAGGKIVAKHTYAKAARPLFEAGTA
ncbi:MAG: nuclear transport factor 2 family protein [Alphaproteobacteria bacterium]|nr:nuclear transport factor 2 family protein [Alphaproteobacteria bacterium]MCY4319717.1 nuclear transport factor 2 family protein [Alphaproteobacteria bacterium]